MPVGHTQGTGDSYCFFACTHGRAACLHGAHARMEWWREAVRGSGTTAVSTIDYYYYAWYYDRGLPTAHAWQVAHERTCMHVCLVSSGGLPEQTCMHHAWGRACRLSYVRAPVLYLRHWSSALIWMRSSSSRPSLASPAGRSIHQSFRSGLFSTYDIL